ncbi:unnamed protein product [Ectocarpus sp. CCAP 1310/34]|nr:unnamed protein product [Ectocarpus sp. CCAP 1310/34]
MSDLKKQRHHRGCGLSPGDLKTGDDSIDGSVGLGNWLGSLPSKEAMASKGLEAKVDMATYGHQSWALTNLGAWRSQSLGASGGGKPADFVKSRQREAKRAMLGTAAAAAAAAATGPGAAPTNATVVEEGADRPVLMVVPAKPPEEMGRSAMVIE